MASATRSRRHTPRPGSAAYDLWQQAREDELTAWAADEEPAPAPTSEPEPAPEPAPPTPASPASGCVERSHDPYVAARARRPAWMAFGTPAPASDPAWWTWARAALLAWGRQHDWPALELRQEATLCAGEDGWHTFTQVPDPRDLIQALAAAGLPTERPQGAA